MYNSNVKIAVGVLTFNRLNLLKQTIESLRNQSRKPDYIIVVNNSSTDGTEDWLASQSDLIVYRNVNNGSSGGQTANIKHCLSTGAEYIWIMDDDVSPAVDCLEKMLPFLNEKQVVAPLRYNLDNEIYFNDTIEFNLDNPLNGLWRKIISRNDIQGDFIKATGITFEGPIFHRNLPLTIGSPEIPFFIYGDDSDYFIRAERAGFKVGLALTAQMNRLLPAPDLSRNFNWKHFYIIRNEFALDMLHGNISVQTIRPILKLFRWLIRARKVSEVKTVFRAFWAGINYKSDTISYH